MKEVRYSRRRFMKTGLACLAGTALDPRAQQDLILPDSKKAVSRTALKSLRCIPTTCNLCAAGCGILAYLDGDRCVQILGNPDHPVSQGHICARGLAGLNQVYDPERLLYPMKRMGQRGDGHWTRITWDEAHEWMVSHLRLLKKEDRFVLDQDRSDPLLDRFMQAFEFSSIINRHAQNKENRKLASKMMTGSPELLPDFRRSRTIFNFGANFLAHHDRYINVVSNLIKAKVDHGAKLISFDVRMSETAAKSDLWIPVKSGTDGVVALALAHTILKNDLADTAFLSRRTNGSLSALKSQLDDYPLSRAEKESGIPASVIEELAFEFATRKPSIAVAGGGVSDQKHGVHQVQAVHLLNVLTGNLGQEGGLFYPPPLSLNTSLLKDMTSSLGIREMIESDSDVHIYLSHASNPVFDESGSQSLTSFFKDEKKVRFSVVFDTHMTETAMLADLVLPAATFLESWGLEQVPTLDQKVALNLRQPVVSLQSPAKILRSSDSDMGKVLEPSFSPRGEAKEIGNVCMEWARRTGGPWGELFAERNTQDFYSRMADRGTGIRKTQEEFRSLKKTGFRIEDPGPILTPGRIDLDRINFKHVSLTLTGEAKPNSQNAEFTLTTFRTGFFAHETSNSKWLREIAHNNPLWINRAVAQKLDLHNGDRVRLSSKNASLVTRVLVTDRIHPDSVAIAQEYGHTETGRIAKAEKFKSPDRDTSLLWWKKEGRGINPNEIVVGQPDPVSGVFSTKDTSVKIEKI